MDIQMPRMSGSETAIQIRKVETQTGHQHIPIIALTAHSLSDERDTLLASGIDDYVGKPISQAQLFLQRWLVNTARPCPLMWFWLKSSDKYQLTHLGAVDSVYSVWGKSPPYCTCNPQRECRICSYAISRLSDYHRWQH